MTMRSKMTPGWMVVVMALCLSPIFNAQASMILTLDNPATLGIDKTIADNTLLDLNPVAGVITFSGNLGPFTINVTTAVSKPVFSGAPEIHLNTLNMTTSSPGTIEIKLTDTDFSISVASGLRSQIGGVTSGLVEAWQSVDFSNHEFATGGLGPVFTIHHPVFSGGAFADEKSLELDGNIGPLSLTEHVKITHSGTGATSLDFASKVPEASASLFLGIGLLSLSGFIGISHMLKLKRGA